MFGFRSNDDDRDPGPSLAERRAELLTELRASRRGPVPRLTRRLPTVGADDTVAEVETLRPAA